MLAEDFSYTLQAFLLWQNDPVGVGTNLGPSHTPNLKPGLSCGVDGSIAHFNVKTTSDIGGRFILREILDTA